jgi:hypothetical protein
VGGVFSPYINVPQTIGAIVSSRLATLTELDTVLGIEDLYDLLEVLSVDTYNKNLANEAIK